MVDLAAHVDDQHAGAVALLDDLGRDAERRHEGGRAAIDDDLHLFRHATGHGGQEIDGKGLVRGLAHCGDLGLHDGTAHGAGTEAAEAARLRDGGHQFGVRDTPHAGQHDGVFDPEQLREASSHVPWLSFMSTLHGVQPYPPPDRSVGGAARREVPGGTGRRGAHGCILTRTFLL